MNDANFKKLLDVSLEPLQKGLGQLRVSLEVVRKELDSVKKDLREVKDIQNNRVLPSLIYIETTVKSYADRYVANQDHIRRLDKRLNTVPSVE